MMGEERMMRKDRIEIPWILQLFSVLKDRKAITTNHECMNFHEKSHLIGMLVKAGLIDVIKIKPITTIKGTENLIKTNNEYLMKQLKDILIPGVVFETPVSKAESEIVDWANKKDGTPIIRYTSLGTKKDEQNFDSDARAEIKRITKLAKISQRRGQAKFSAGIRINYDGKCAVTGCNIREVLEAAHIKIYNSADDFCLDNGILLRADIHALFDALLFTINEACMTIEICDELKGSIYSDLHGKRIATPVCGLSPSKENISHHRERFRKIRMREK
ncbi:HNH endonuclease [Gluconobacter kondonii]|nr:HNH endonuclease [Gluconobacter kondonii]